MKKNPIHFNQNLQQPHLNYYLYHFYNRLNKTEKLQDRDRKLFYSNFLSYKIFFISLFFFPSIFFISFPIFSLSLSIKIQKIFVEIEGAQKSHADRIQIQTSLRVLLISLLKKYFFCLFKLLKGFKSKTAPCSETGLKIEFH